MAHLLRRQDVRAEPFDATKVRSSAGRRSVSRRILGKTWRSGSAVHSVHSRDPERLKRVDQRRSFSHLGCRKQSFESMNARGLQPFLNGRR